VKLPSLRGISGAGQRRIKSPEAAGVRAESSRLTRRLGDTLTQLIKRDL